MNSRDRQRLLKVKQAAKVLGVSPNTILAWGATGKIPEYRHPANGYRLYKRCELEDILEKIEASKSDAKRHRQVRGS